MFDSDDPFADEATPSQEPAMPDGIGLSVEEIRTLLSQKHNTLVAPDDPLLMTVTILNAFLNEQQAQNDKLKAGMSKLLADKTDSYVTGVQTATDSLAEKLQSSSSEGLQKTLQGLHDTLANFKSTMILLSVIVSLSAILNIAVFVFKAIR